MNNSYKLVDIPEKLKKNNYNYIEFVGKDTYIKKKFVEIYVDLMKTLTYFSKIGISQGGKIGIIGSNSYEYMLVDLAAIVGGYVSVPFTEKDFNGSIEQLNEEFELEILFTDEKYYTFDCGDDIYLLCDLLRTIEQEESFTGPLPILNEEADFTVVFTSGTTGIAKGIAVRVKCVEEWIKNVVDAFCIKQDDKLLNFLNLSISNARLFVYAAILIPYNMTLTRVDFMAKAMILSRPTILQAVPYLFESFYWTMRNDIKKSKKMSLQYSLYCITKKILPSSVTEKLVKRLSKRLKNYFGGNIRILVTGSAPISINVLQFYDNMGMRLYESYGINEVGLVSINNPNDYRIGSVGKVFKTKEINFTEQHEILIKSDYSWGRCYINDTQQLGKSIYREDGYVATGDIGHMDKDGFLYIDGRLKEVICLKNGIKIHPKDIEEELKKTGLVKQAAVFGNGREFVVCVVVPIEQQGLRWQRDEFKSKVHKMMPERFKTVQFVLADVPFTVENGLMNTTLKNNMIKIYNKYRKEIEAFYK